ncbi:MAG: two-component regulator propeller domain-containing protein [Cytophagales bacterium]
MRTLIFAFVLLSIQSKAQIYTFDHLGIEEGMSQNQVNAITKDQFGFMWFGTWDGLNRYDGHNFKVYKHKAFDTTSLSSNFISNILNDSKGRLWIGTNGGGLNLFIPEDESFLNFKFDPLKENSISNNAINQIFEDNQGNIWVATEFGLNLIRASGNTDHIIEQFFFQNKHLPGSSNFISTITEIKNGNYLIGTDKGMIGLKLESDNSFTFNLINPFEHQSPRSFNVKCVFIDSLNHLWVGCNKSLFVSKKAVSNFNFKLNPYSTGNFSQGIKFINQDIEGSLWIGTLDGKLLSRKPGTNTKFNLIREDHIRNNFQSEITYTTFYQSSDEKILWIGTDIDGVKKLSLSGRNFQNIAQRSNELKGLINSAVFSVYTDKKGYNWYGTRKGISIQNPKTNEFYNYQKSNSSLNKISNTKIRAFEEDGHGNIWVGTIDGLGKIKIDNTDLRNLERAAIEFYNMNNSNEFGLYSNYIYDIHFSRSGILWIATREGLYQWLPEKEIFEEFIYLPEDFYDKNVFTIKNIYEDSQGSLWLSTFGGLHRISNKKGKYEFGHFFHDPLNTNGICSNDINHVHEDSNGNYWIATAHGLNQLRFENQKAIFQYYGYEQGLPNEFLYSIYSDKKNNLWMSSNMGIITYNPETEEFKNFVRGDGILSNEFNIGAFHQKNDGKIMFGSIAGVTQFYPEDIIVNLHLPKVHITSVKRFGKEIYSFRDLLDNPDLSFENDENNFTVEFVALDFTNPRKNEYAYKLEGLDKDWIQLGNQRRVSFSQLKPGNYTLMVRGSNNNGIWNEHCAELKFSITPPFWQMSEFFISVVLVISVLIYLVYRKKLNDKIRYVLKIEKMQNDLNEKVRRKAAADFHDEMGHYLTRINVLTEILKQRLKEQSEDIRGVVHSIGEQSQKLYNGTRDFIWTINPDNNSVYELAIRLKDFGDEMTLETEVNFVVSGIEESLKENILTTDFARHLVLIFKEAINNSVKHSNAKNIELSFNKIQNSTIPMVTLSDDGIGIQDTENNLGNGLLNMKKRARKIAAELSVESNIPKGTLIRLKPNTIISEKLKTA